MNQISILFEAMGYIQKVGKYQFFKIDSNLD